MRFVADTKFSSTFILTSTLQGILTHQRMLSLTAVVWSTFRTASGSRFWKHVNNILICLISFVVLCTLFYALKNNYFENGSRGFTYFLQLFLRAAVTKFHMLGGLSSSSGGQRFGRHRGWCLPRAVRKGLFHASLSQWLTAHLWCSLASRCSIPISAFTLTWCSPCVQVCLWLSPFYKRLPSCVVGA